MTSMDKVKNIIYLLTEEKNQALFEEFKQIIVNNCSKGIEGEEVNLLTDLTEADLLIMLGVAKAYDIPDYTPAVCIDLGDTTSLKEFVYNIIDKQEDITHGIALLALTIFYVYIDDYNTEE